MSKTLKKTLALLLSVVLIVSLLSTAALAAGRDNGRYNRSYDRCFGRVQVCANITSMRQNAQLLRLELMVEAANSKVELLVKHAQRTPYDDVDWLLRNVEATVAPVFSYAKSIGAVAICEYVEYYIDGQYVLVDPIRVIKR